MRIGAAVLSVALVAAGCGGDDDDDAAAPTPEPTAEIADAPTPTASPEPTAAPTEPPAPTPTPAAEPEPDIESDVESEVIAAWERYWELSDLLHEDTEPRRRRLNSRVLRGRAERLNESAIDCSRTNRTNEGVRTRAEQCRSGLPSTSTCRQRPRSS